MTKETFFIVGPTAVGKSQLAADVASELGAEIVSADAFQIYRGLNLLSAKPDPATVGKVPHHLIGVVALSETMNAEKYRNLALQAFHDIHSRGRIALVVGGSGLYLKALTHGLSSAPAADPDLRAQLNELSLVDLQEKLLALDPNTRIDLKNRRRLVRAIEICLLSGSPASEQRKEWDVVAAGAPTGRAQNLPTTQGVFVFRDRDDLYQRINRRVEEMFENGLI
ncbi:MAG TPA: tRNA (adenosine(37)-N6)-dimethylallyltransferase MiaA, partial [Chthoniobacterales bacterium]|nr:tRNA (adenosine(37)-N6)-dimethylallyltransferase MiaA [Chthoniobacterales bacterium]